MQISTKNLSPQTQKQLFDNLHVVLADIKNPAEIQLFLTAFLTSTEYTVLAKRLNIAQLLSEGLSYDKIRQKLGVSSATISSVSENLQKEGIQIALQRIKVNQWAHRTASKIQKILGGGRRKD